MTAITPLLLSLAAFVAQAPAPTLALAPTAMTPAHSLPAPSAWNLCVLDALGASEQDSCRAIAGAGETEDGYATPVEVDCRVVAGAGGGPAARQEPQTAAACNFPVVDFRYRVSRVPDSERPSGSLGPGKPRRNATPLATTSGVPTEQGGLSTLASSQPLAVFALGEPDPPRLAGVPDRASASAPTRILEPVDRPPRA